MENDLRYLAALPTEGKTAAKAFQRSEGLVERMIKGPDSGAIGRPPNKKTGNKKACQISSRTPTSIVWSAGRLKNADQIDDELMHRRHDLVQLGRQDPTTFGPGEHQC